MVEVAHVDYRTLVPCLYFCLLLYENSSFLDQMLLFGCIMYTDWIVCVVDSVMVRTEVCNLVGRQLLPTVMHFFSPILPESLEPAPLNSGLDSEGWINEEYVLVIQLQLIFPAGNWIVVH